MIRGKPGKQAEARIRVLPAYWLRVRPPFHLMIEPEVYDWDPVVKEYLPTLMQARLSPGCQGVGEKREASAMVAYWISKGRLIFRDGATLLKMPDDESEFLQGGHFRAEFLARIGKTSNASPAYGWAWEGYEIAGKDLVQWDSDKDVERRFRRHIVSAGILPALSIPTRRYKIKTTRGHLRRAHDRSQEARTAGAARKVKRLEVRLKDLLDDLERAGGGGTAEPQSGRIGGMAASNDTTIDGLPVTAIPADAEVA